MNAGNTTARGHIRPATVVRAAIHPPDPVSRLSPIHVDGQWLALQQAWLGTRTEPRFQPGWSRIRWNPAWFCVETVFLCNRPANRARRLNERTWELGDVCETFLQEVGRPTYLEIHVTPENQRLQLEFGEGDIARLRAGLVPLENFQSDNPDWVESSTHLSSGFWATQVIVPAARFGPGPLSPTRYFVGTVCRYDCDDAQSTVLSASAPLTEPSYHQRAAWHRFELAPTSLEHE